MPKEIIDVIDTAVKIGLGALISGVATYYVTVLNHNKETEKDFDRRKKEIIEAIAEDVETFSNAALVYWAYLVEFTRYKESEEKIPRGLKDKVLNAGNRIFQDTAKLTSAESKLLLLGFDGCELAVRDYADFVKKLRRTAWEEESSLTTAQVESFREELKNKRRCFYEELKTVYKR